MSTLSLPPLPTDVQHSIGMQADRSLFSTLTRVSPTLHSLMLNRVFEHIQLSLPMHYGEHPVIQPFDRNDKANHRPWAMAEAAKARDRRSEAMSEKGYAICDAASKKNWVKVKSLLIETQQGGMEGIMAVLRRAAPTVRNLEIQGTHVHDFVVMDGDGVDPQFLHRMRNTLEFNMLVTPINFPFLTHLTIRVRALCESKFYPFICHHAPTLVTLVASLECFDLGENIHQHMPFPPLTGLNNLRQIQVSWGETESEGVEWHGGQTHYHCLAILLDVSPKLERLAIRQNIIGGIHTYPTKVIEAIARHLGLQDVVWNTSPVALFPYHSYPSGGSLRRLVLRVDNWLDTFVLLPPLHNLTALYLDYTLSPGLVSITGLITSSDSSDTQAMLPDFSLQLRRNVNVRFIHHLREGSSAWGLEAIDVIDEIDRSESHTGFVSSLRHGNDELLHVRIFTDVAEISDCISIWRPEPPPLIDNRRRVILGPKTYLDGTHRWMERVYSLPDRTKRTRKFERRSNFTWVQLTDNQGRVVPLEVISEMQRVEGGEVDWDRRGVEVGHAAWRVLLDWFEADAGTGTV